MDFRPVRTPVSKAETDQDICWGVLSILYQYVSVFVVRKDPGIKQLVFKRVRVRFAPAVFLHQIRIRKRPMRILVEGLHVAVGRSIIQIEVILLHVFPVISFTVSEPEKAFLQNRVVAVPERQRKAKPGFLIGDASQTIFTPPISTRTGVIMGKVIPGGAALTVILANRTPLPIAQVGSPQPPRGFSIANSIQSLFLLGHIYSQLNYWPAL